jgi:DEAD/DEAH box helicase domain-containing protein
MNLEQMLDYFRASDNIMKNITSWVEIPAREAQYSDFPECLDKRLVAALEKRGVHKLYTHQASAVAEVGKGKDIVVVTPTASGKTMCYNLPVLNAILKDEESRAIFLFPTKALSQDQTSELHELITEAGIDVKTFTYDGDTPQSARKAIRQAGHIVVTNPDMLHSGILPHHTKWTKLFENLKYIVIDEVHHYRGVFGSHLANVIRRLMRICEFYGSRPQFICCSATIANPAELAARITGREMVLVDNNGAPSASKHILFYNPPIVNKELGIRKSSLLEAKNLAEALIRNGVQTIVFTRSRLNVEVLVTYLKEIFHGKMDNNKVRGYRGGYLPNLRREIERGLRDGSITGVVSTNALELGIDIGALEACIVCGYPGTIASTWQQAGRAGRRNGVSATILIASSSPLDQYIINNPDYFFGKSPENGLINPDNLVILYNHMKCAAFELPFTDDEKFGVETTQEILSYMADARILRHVGGRWHWMSDVFPADEIGLRNASNENFIIIDITEAKHKVIAETDRFSAPMLVHEEAIYIHEGQQYQVEKLDFDDKKAYVRRVNVDYYTDANLAVDLKVIDVFREDNSKAVSRNCGEVMVTALVTMFKKIKLHTHENIGSGPVDLPELEMHTTSYWFSLPEDIPEGMKQSDVENGLLGMSNILANAAPVYLMCDPGDIRVVHQVRSTFTQRPTVYIYDSCPGGVGFSEKLYELHEELFSTAETMIRQCGCETGCPSCVGPLNEFTGTDNPKELTLKLIDMIKYNV